MTLFNRTKPHRENNSKIRALDDKELVFVSGGHGHHGDLLDVDLDVDIKAKIKL